MALKKQTWRTVNRRRAKMLVKWIKRMRIQYVEWGKPIVRQIEQNGVSDIDTFIDQLSTEDITNELVKLYIDVGVHFANASFENAKAYIPTIYKKDFLTDKWEVLMANFSQEQAFEIFSSIRQTPKTEAKRIVKNIIADAASSGEGIEAIARKIAKEFGAEWGKGARWMGRRVAQTETIRASNYATIEGVKGLGVEFHKAWLVARDGKERTSHDVAANENTNIPEHGKFIVSGQSCDYPVDPVLTAEESINCRCAVTAFPVEI